MNKISPQQFAALCYCIQIGEPMNVSYDYMEQNLQMLGDGYNAYSYLNLTKKLRVAEYLGKWRTEIPPEIKKYQIIPDEVAFDLIETGRKLNEEKSNKK